MRRFAHIQEGKVHWVYHAAQQMAVAPYIVTVELTGRDPMPQEGWGYDGSVFSAPDVPIAHTPDVPLTTVHHAHGGGRVVSIMRHALNRADPGMSSHTNPLDHDLFVLRGSLAVTVAGDTQTVLAGQAVTFQAGVEHSWTAEEDQTVVLNIQ